MSQNHPRVSLRHNFDADFQKKGKFQSAAVPALDVQIEQCESFIARSQRRVAALDAQRAAGWPSCKVVHWRNLGVNRMQGEKRELGVV